MRVAYFDCFCGAAGDMIVGALIDAGADTDALRQGLTALGLRGYTLSIEPVTKQGFAATRFRVDLENTGTQPHRHLSDILGIIDRSGLPESVRSTASRVFTRLGEAEAKVHGGSIEQVHFHEVGAVDAMLDIVGAVLALDLLGVDRIVCSPLPVGSGTIHCEHGILPVPAPATAELLMGVPLASTQEEGELLTPTGAALVTTLAEEFGPIPAMMVQSIGYGAGTRETTLRPNLLRVLIGGTEDDGTTDEITVLETSLDDTAGELIGRCQERLFEAGALDVYTVPIQMKKSRPGVLLTVLCEPRRRSEMERILFAETTTFGVRRHNAIRSKLARRHETVSTSLGEVRIKIGERDGIITVSPEYEDCRILAEENHVAVRDVISAANAAWASRK
ncbi:MAG: nickel pincer cofactor biosynthesis protein LarC [Planctomycetes bacterium]|nr:nickel pincer cofactor biosynthesis protein LarC [Planctomycetota bacterium]